MEETKKSGFATASLVLGIIGLCTSFIPIVNNVSFILALIGGIFAVVSLIKKASKGMAIAGLIICIITSIVVYQAQKTLSDTVNDAVDTFNNNMDMGTGEKTDEILANYADVNIGEFKATKSEYTTETELPVTVKNKASENKSFSIQIEAVRADGSRITSDTVYVNNLNAGQSQDFKAFEFVSSDMLEDIKTATFKIVEVSMY